MRLNDETAFTEIHLWEVGVPNLYDLELTLMKDGTCMDKVTSYFGLRSVSIKGKAICINGKPVFQRLVLEE